MSNQVSCQVNFFLDENVPPRAVHIFNDLGFQCFSVQGLGKKGISDEEVLKLAIEHSACLCTTNGKDFVIQIPPERQLSITHHGLVWVKGPGAWSRKNSDEIINFIIKNIEIAYPIDNHIFEVNRETIVFNWNKIYPL